MHDATLAILKARRDEQVALTGVLAALFCDEPDELLRRLECIRDSARECARNAGRDRSRKQLYHRIASVAEDMLPWCRSLIEQSDWRPPAQAAA